MRSDKKLSKIDENCFFVVVICMILALGIACFFRSPKEVSKEENRNLAQFTHLVMKDVLNGKFQDEFEDALSDQFLLSGRIKNWYGEITAALPKFGLDAAVCSGRYVSLLNDAADLYRSFNCDDYIVHKPEVLSEGKIRNLEQNITRFNHVNAVADAYYYVIDMPSTFDFASRARIVDYEDMLKSKMSGKFSISSFRYANYDEYRNLFYKTDHHWNYKGSYLGFLDIMEMLGIKDPIAPTGIFTNHENFFGSLSKATRKYDSLEEFTIYTYNVPRHKVDIRVYDRNESTYNRIDEYIKHDYTYDKLTDYYEYVYGFDRGEIVLDFNHPEKENLIIVADSFSNPINELIAQYFNKTYVLDLRHYEKHIGEEFALSKYLKSHDVSKVLFIMSTDIFLAQVNTTKGLEL